MACAVAVARLVICTLCDPPHRVLRPWPEPIAAVTARDLEILTRSIEDPLTRAHVARVVYAVGEGTWGELIHLASLAEIGGSSSWPSSAIERLAGYTYKRLAALADHEQSKLRWYERHRARLGPHQRRTDCSNPDHIDIWNFFGDEEELIDDHVWTLRILRRLERPHRPRGLSFAHQ
jgi:hypothetical protein